MVNFSGNLHSVQFNGLSQIPSDLLINLCRDASNTTNSIFASNRHQTFTFINGIPCGEKNSARRVHKRTSEQHAREYLMAEILQNSSS